MILIISKISRFISRNVPICLNNLVKEQFNFHEFLTLLKYTKNSCVRLSEIPSLLIKHDTDLPDVSDTGAFLNLYNLT